MFWNTIVINGKLAFEPSEDMKELAKYLNGKWDLEKEPGEGIYKEITPNIAPGFITIPMDEEKDETGKTTKRLFSEDRNS